MKNKNVYLKITINCLVLTTLWIGMGCFSKAKSSVFEHKMNSSNYFSIDKKITGEYLFGTNCKEGKCGKLLIYQISDSVCMFYVDVCMGPTAYNNGALYGKFVYTDNKRLFTSVPNNEEDDCILTFHFSKNMESVKVEKNGNSLNCPFGVNVDIEDTYLRSQKKQNEFFVDRHGDSIYFEKTSVEQYYDIK